MKELSVEIRLRNNRLRQSRLDLGLSQKELAEQAAVSQGIISALETLKISPVLRNGSVRDGARQLALFLDVELSWLFPDSLTSIQKSSVERLLDVVECRELLGQSTKQLASGDTPKRIISAIDIDKVLLTLTRREEKVLRMHYYKDLSFAEIAETLGMTRSRVRMIEMQALIKLRRPSRSRPILGKVEYVDWKTRKNSSGLDD